MAVGKKAKNAEVDAYIAAQPKEAQSMLKKIRRTIRQAAPQAEELISYGMPGYRQNGMVAWFAAAKKHCGLYAVPAVLRKFKDELRDYETSKSAVRLPIGKTVPTSLVSKIVKQALRNNQEKLAIKKTAMRKKPG